MWILAIAVGILAVAVILIGTALFLHLMIGS
jgi:hypothetical protein